MRAKHFLIADTETVGLKPVNFVYDLGYVIATRKEILLERSMLITEIITDPKKMMSAYYAKKIFTHYIPALDKGLIHLWSWAEVVNQLRADMEEYKIDVFCAYNLPFDMGALSATNNLLSDDPRILNYKPDLLDLYYFACSGALNSRLYHDLAYHQESIHGDHSWVSAANNVRTTAEKAYAFLAGDIHFVESHTALEDAQIETEILRALLKRKTPIPYNKLVGMPWRTAQKIKGDMELTRAQKARKIQTQS